MRFFAPYGARLQRVRPRILRSCNCFLSPLALCNPKEKEKKEEGLNLKIVTTNLRSTTSSHTLPAGLQSRHSQLRPILNLPRVQPVAESILRLVLAEEKVSFSWLILRFYLQLGTRCPTARRT